MTERVQRRVLTTQVSDEIRKIEREGHYDWLSIRADGDFCVIVLELRPRPDLETRA